MGPRSQRKFVVVRKPSCICKFRKRLQEFYTRFKWQSQGVSQVGGGVAQLATHVTCVEALEKLCSRNVSISGTPVQRMIVWR